MTDRATICVFLSTQAFIEMAPRLRSFSCRKMKLLSVKLIQVGGSKSDPQHHCLQCSQKHDEASTVFYRWLYLNQKFQF